MKSVDLIKIFIIGLVCLLISGQTAFCSGIKDRMKQRLPEIAQLKSQGIIGETNRGYLGYVGSQRVKEDVINAENEDRKKVYTYFAKQQNTTLEVVEQVQGKRKAEKALPGEYIQTPEGDWVKK